MLGTSSTAIGIGYYESNGKIYPKNNFRYSLSNAMKETVEIFRAPEPDIFQLDAEKFAEWLKNAYEKSSFKTLTALAEAVDSNKATISRLMSAAPQTLTGKPSQPRPALVMRLAEVLGADEIDGLAFAGHASYSRPNRQPKNLAEFLASLEALGLEQFAFSADKAALENYSPEEYEELLERIKADVEITIRRKRI
jgi:hypothetical protein